MTTIKVDAGKVLLVVGANDAALGELKSSDRCIYMNANAARGMKGMPAPNIGVVVVNGKLPEDIRENVKKWADGEAPVYCVADGGELVALLTAMGVKSKGVLTIETDKVTEAFGVPADPSKVNPPKDAQSLDWFRTNIKAVFDEKGGNKKEVINAVRAAGHGPDKVTDSAIYGWMSEFKGTAPSRGRRPAAAPGLDVSALMASGVGERLGKAITALGTAVTELTEAAHAALAENQQQRSAIENLQKQVAELPELRKELERLKELEAGLLKLAQSKK